VPRLDSLASFAWVNKQQQDWMQESCNVSVKHTAESTLREGVSRGEKN